MDAHALIMTAATQIYAAHLANYLQRHSGASQEPPLPWKDLTMSLAIMEAKLLWSAVNQEIRRMEYPATIESAEHY